MRAGGCTVQQALTPEAATVVKQAVTLAKRRGHAQVTPLHVANTMLSPSSSGSGSVSGLFRNACLQSHSYPLQCKALELCFNVALNRLPASTSSCPMLGGATHSHHHYPSISNALVAAFKRAQAHQRRGSIENQQQPILAVKIELEQLIISILDDPSVSRVMKEAGFSSTQVKSNVEQVVSTEICASKPSHHSPKSSLTNKETSTKGDLVISNQATTSTSNGCGIEECKELMNKLDPLWNEEDVVCVIDCLVNKRRSLVIIGENLVTIEGVVKGVKEKVDKGGAHEALWEVKFVNLSLSSLGQLSMEDFDQKLQELKAYMGNGGGVILNLGDLQWAIECRSSSMERLIIEVGKLLANNGKFWIIGIATFQTFMKCKSSYPSLETIWDLHSITIPSGILSLSLITIQSDLRSTSTMNKSDNGSNWICGEEKQHSEHGSLIRSCTQSPTSNNLPPWLQSYKNESTNLNKVDQECGYTSPRTLTLSSISPSSSTSKQSLSDNNFLVDPDLTIRLPGPEQQFMITSNPNNSSKPNSCSSSDIVMEMEHNVHNKFKNLNPENLKILSNALEKKVPWQKDMIPELTRIILKCRSGTRAKRNGYEPTREDAWLLFEGIDVEGKEKIASELARLVFGSCDDLMSINFSSFSSSSSRAESKEENCSRNKRSRDEQSACSYMQRFTKVVSINPHRVFFIEDVDQGDYCSQLGFKRAIERGRVSNGDQEVGLSDAIVILSCENFNPRSSSRSCSPLTKRKAEGFGSHEDHEKFISLDLNISIDDNCVEDNSSLDEIGLLDFVHGRFVFNIQEL